MQSGNSDSPPSSDHERADRIVRDILDGTHMANPSPSGELYRAISRFHRRGEVARHTSGAMDQDLESSRRRHRSREESSPLFVLPPAAQHSIHESRQQMLSRAEPRRSRARISADSRHLQRARLSLEDSITGNGLADLQNAGRQLEQASSSLRALLDTSVSMLSSPSLEEMEYSGEATHNRRLKRRKLDSEHANSEHTGFRYGKYGQVEPGKLNMEIVSCDGGIYEQKGVNYAAENILRNDDTVYCTKSNRCNLVLRHQGATVFSLKELIIKAPHHGYTAPVQEGMVFVSMTSDDLLTRTAQYQIQYSPARNSQSSFDRSNDLAPIRSIRYNQDTPMSSAQEGARRLYNIGLRDEECDYRTAQIPADFTSNVPPFQVTTECSDSEGDEVPSRAERNLRAFRQITAAQLDSSSDSEDGIYASRGARSPRLRRRETASNITLAEAAEASQVATQEAVRAVGGELMVPHARFFIERDKSKCTVKFDPPVSGRFILLKMWSPHHSPSGNIDVQSVVAKGFSGPRFFPDITFR